ncbi:hypothetical protein FRB94_003000 [Tulasnella sp. JGI-2019a]|nr:hypothetical protein FRB93_010954 [Tulasnella sp. JGI-2019a]KAG8986244.1 hypothetical protein FRB94_003000 [Tulasnella sp. JGI-2019a]
MNTCQKTGGCSQPPPTEVEDGTGDHNEQPHAKKKKGKNYTDFEPQIMETPQTRQLSEKALASQKQSRELTPQRHRNGKQIKAGTCSKTAISIVASMLTARLAPTDRVQSIKDNTNVLHFNSVPPPSKPSMLQQATVSWGQTLLPPSSGQPPTYQPSMQPLSHQPSTQPQLPSHQLSPRPPQPLLQPQLPQPPSHQPLLQPQPSQSPPPPVSSTLLQPPRSLQILCHGSANGETLLVFDWVKRDKEVAAIKEQLWAEEEVHQEQQWKEWQLANTAEKQKAPSKK